MRGLMDWVILGTLVVTFATLISVVIYMLYRNNILIARNNELYDDLSALTAEYEEVCEIARTLERGNKRAVPGRHHTNGCSASEELVEELYRLFPPEMYQVDGNSIGLVIPEDILMGSEGPDKVRALRFLATYYREFVEFSSSTVDHHAGGMRVVFKFVKEGVW